MVTVDTKSDTKGSGKEEMINSEQKDGARRPVFLFMMIYYGV